MISCLLRLPSKGNFDFMWTIAEKSISFDSLQPHQIVNHFNGIMKLTTKSGLCDILQEMCWICESKDVISPRYE